ncbi:MAG: hypothetical protein RLZZ163_1513 [Actinomycetota bacterium]
MTTRECKLDGSAEAGALRMAEDSDEAFADALLEIAQSADNGRALGMRGQAWARSNLGWEALALQADAAYASARNEIRK